LKAIVNVSSFARKITLPLIFFLVCSIVCGTVLASHFFGVGVFYLLGLVTLSYALLAVSPGIRGSAIAALVVSYNIGKQYSFLV
jgi:hypothetical protein